MGVIIKAFVDPPKAGFIVELWWLSPEDEWMNLEAKTTDQYGRAEWSYSFASYPQTVRIQLPAGQIIKDVEYEGVIMGYLILEDTQEGHFHLHPEVRTSLDPIVAVASAILGTALVIFSPWLR